VAERTPRVTIEYCTQCRWLLRAAWLAQELLTTFETELAEVALVPGTGGVLDVRLDGELIFSRKQAERFPESKELKQAIRDRIAPGRSLGHSDASAEGARSEAKPSEDQND
jgi:selenoprotein W-related protein